MTFSITDQSNTPSPHILAHLILCWLEKGSPCSSRSKRDRRNSCCRLIVYHWATTSCRHSFPSKIVNYRFDSVLFFYFCSTFVSFVPVYFLAALNHRTILSLYSLYFCTFCSFLCLRQYCTALTWKNSVTVSLFIIASSITFVFL